MSKNFGLWLANTLVIVTFQWPGERHHSLTVVAQLVWLGGLGLVLGVAAAGEQVCDARYLQTHAVGALKNLVAVLNFVK